MADYCWVFKSPRGTEMSLERRVNGSTEVTIKNWPNYSVTIILPHGTAESMARWINGDKTQEPQRGECPDELTRCECNVWMPDSIPIGPVRFRGRRPADLRSDDGVRLDGQINHSNATIDVLGNMNDLHSLVILLHEVIHGICAQSGYDVSEEIIGCLASGLLRFLQDVYVCPSVWRDGLHEDWGCG